MSIRCPTCSRANPANATYCYYDGRGLNEAARNGPLGLGTLPFPLPFSFSDGHGCANYNQLVLACDRRWSEARRYLVNGTWKSFFDAIGRADLATVAVLAASQPDPDVGLCHLLERLPADAEALRPPRLALTSPVEDLGTLQPGKDYKVELVIENRGMLLLRGSVMMGCDWLAFGEGQGNASTKLFQTRDTYALSVRVLGSKLRAGKKPLEGQIVIDTNGGRQTVSVRATVPIRAFPRGQAANDVLAGATSPREIAVRAKAHPEKAAILFEQGAVKTWYGSNGWTYPIQGTHARGRGALQQFFEALGLTKPPRLEISTEQIVCLGVVGQHLTKNVTVRTAEARFVHVEAHSNQDWVKVLPVLSHGNSATLRFRIETPPRPGEVFNASVTILGNGQQQFVVPVTLSVAASAPESAREGEPVKRGHWLQRSLAGGVWLRRSLAGGVLCLSLVIALTLFLSRPRSNPPVNPPTDPTGGPIAGPPKPPVPKVEPWWHDIPGTKLSAAVAELKKTAGANRPIFERLERKSELDRREGYEQLAAKLPELARKPETRDALGRFVSECCVYEPTEFNITPLLRGLTHQFPAEDSPFPPGDKGEEVECACFWLRVVCDTLAHKAARLDRSQSLVGGLENVFGSALDPSASPLELADQAEKALAQQCYHNLLPTADQSIEQALSIREVLITRFPRHLKPAFRDQEDVKLLAIGLSKGNDLWPRLAPIFKTCVDSNAIPIGLKLTELYEQANADLAPKMEVLLAGKWKAAGNPRLTRAAKAEAIRKAIAAQARAARIAPAERLKQLQELLARSPLAAARPDGPVRTAPLQDSLRLAHVSTMACILFSKNADLERFDELIGRIPGSEPDKVAQEKKPEDQPPRPEKKEVIDLGAGNYTTQGELTDSEADPRREAYRKVYSVRLQAGEIYVLDMRSTDMKPYLRVENGAGVPLAGDRGANTHLIFSPPADGVYRIVASSADKKVVGRFTLQIARQQILRIGAPPAPPSPPAATTVEQDAPQLNPSDLTDLGHKQSNVRIAAFKNLTRSPPKNLAYRHAQKIATYLLLTEWQPPEPELEAVTSQLPALAKCRHLLEALADAIANEDKLTQRRTEVVVGGLLKQPLQFARDEDWRSACRKLLLQRALELTGRPSDEADKAAEVLRDLYKEQGLAFGLEDPDFLEQTQITVVLEGLIKHVAATSAAEPEDKAYLEQIGRQLQAARFVAENDLEYTVLLQRIWIKVLVLTSKGRLPAETRKRMKTIQQDLDKKDREATHLLEQLRSGEENILRVWALAHDLKVP